MTETERKAESIRKIFIPLSVFSFLTWGLCFLCDPDKLCERIYNGWQGTFKSLLSDSNEREEAQVLLEKIPDGQERSIAQMINYAMGRYRRSRGRNFDGSRANKPHQVMLEVLRQVSEAIDRL
jgi:hypothetical protein